MLCVFAVAVNAPFRPEVTGATDTSNFDVDDSEMKHTVSYDEPFFCKSYMLPYLCMIIC